MSHPSDVLIDPGPDERTQVRDALARRAQLGPGADPAVLFGSAQRRARTRHRHQVTAGVLAALVVLGAALGAVALTHGPTSAGVSVATPGVTTPTTAATTTTAGATTNPLTPQCGDLFFPSATDTQLRDHFGPRLSCTRVDSTWVVGFGGPAQGTITVALLACTAGDEACLDPAATHDFGAFRVLYLPPTTTTGTTSTFSFTTSAAPHATDIQVTFGYPLLPPTIKPVPTVRIQKSSDEPALDITVGAECEPVKGPATTRWIGPFALVPGPTALSSPLPAWSTLPTELTTAC